MIPLLMIHGIGCDGSAFNRMAGLFSAHGFLTRTPTLFPDLRVSENPPEGLARLGLHDYVEAIAKEAKAFAAETGRPVALLGHSMGGLIVQKLASQGIGAAGVLLTPAQPPECQVFSLSTLVTFWNIVKVGDPHRAYKVWRKGFDWGVLNQVPKDQRDAIYARALYDSGLVYRDIGQAAKDPHKTAFIDAKDVSIPLLTVCAGRDRATVPAAVRKVAAKYRDRGGQLLEYPRNGHWIVDEPGTDRVVKDIAGWLKRHIGET
jgi:alpha-beta hydrolase superfamily lysophospholipase